MSRWLFCPSSVINPRGPSTRWKSSCIIRRPRDGLSNDARSLPVKGRPFHAAPFRYRVGEPEISRPGSFRRRLIGGNGARRRIGDHHGTAQRYAPQLSAIAIAECLRLFEISLRAHRVYLAGEWQGGTLSPRRSLEFLEGAQVLAFHDHGYGPWHFHSPCAFPAAQPSLRCISRVPGVYGLLWLPPWVEDHKQELTENRVRVSVFRFAAVAASP